MHQISQTFLRFRRAFLSGGAGSRRSGELEPLTEPSIEVPPDPDLRFSLGGRVWVVEGDEGVSLGVDGVVIILDVGEMGGSCMAFPSSGRIAACCAIDCASCVVYCDVSNEFPSDAAVVI